MNPALIALASQVGAPILRRILERKIGTKGAKLTSEILGEIGERLGVRPLDVEDLALSDPERVSAVLPEIETLAAERMAIYASEVEYQLEALKAEQDDPAWMRAWRPAGMYLIGFLWLWNVVLLHIANAFWKIKLPPVEFEQLMGLTALYLSLYMGGHTVKDIVSKWVAK
jgi:hypothetical protein